MACRACHEECNDSCSGPGPTDCFGQCRNFALPTADNTITCVAQCPINTYVNTSNNFCIPCNEVCVPNTGCTGPSDRVEEGGCNHCYFVHRDQNLSQISCLDDTCISGTYLNFPFDPVEPFPFPTRFCDNCHEDCKPCNASMGQCTTCNGPGPTNCLESVASSVITAIPMLMCPPVASQLYNITVTCTIHPDSTADQCVVMAMADGRVTRTGTAAITNRMATVTINDLQCGVIYNITAEGALNGTLVGPKSLYREVTAGPCPVIPINDESDDDELSTGVAVAISIVVTFIITLVVTALISIIITSLYCKHHYNKKSLIRQEDDSHALTEDIKSNDPANITMDTNPAYGTATTIKMDTNPAYTTTTSH